MSIYLDINVYNYGHLGQHPCLPDRFILKGGSQPGTW